MLVFFSLTKSHYYATAKVKIVKITRYHTFI